LIERVLIAGDRHTTVGPNLSTTFNVPGEEDQFTCEWIRCGMTRFAVGGFVDREIRRFNSIDQQTIHGATSHQRRLLPADDISSTTTTKYFNDDMHQDDDFETANGSSLWPGLRCRTL
jgi:hypothetical protein